MRKRLILLNLPLRPLVADHDQTGDHLFAQVQDLFRRTSHPQVGRFCLAPHLPNLFDLHVEQPPAHLAAPTGYLFYINVLNAATQTTLWCIVFFFASAAASAGYLTVSEIFPMEIRAMAIALFYSIATAIGGISGPVLFGNIIGTGNAASLFVAYLVGAGFMIFAAVVELLISS